MSDGSAAGAKPAKKSAAAVKDPLQLLIARALGDDGGALRGAHGYQLWAASNPPALESCKTETDKLPAEARNGFRSKYWAQAFATEPQSVRDEWNEKATKAVAAARKERDEMFSKTATLLPPSEAQE